MGCGAAAVLSSIPAGVALPHDMQRRETGCYGLALRVRRDRTADCCLSAGGDGGVGRLGPGGRAAVFWAGGIALGGEAGDADAAVECALLPTPLRMIKQ